MSSQSPMKEGDASSPSPSPSPSPSSSSSALTFSIRIVSIDYYMSPPITDLDFCYNTTTTTILQGRKKVEQVPVIRIFGSTPPGQKACLHIHRALPYLYILCPEDVLQNPEEGHTFVHTLSSSLEKALMNKSSTPKRQHIHGCHFVRAKKLYGYHSSDDLFVKIYLYYPHEVARTATLLLDGAILNRRFQPYESHIPYLLQFLVDYNLYGMSHIHTTKFKFRPLIPDVYIPTVDSFKKQALGNSAIWLSSTVPNTLIWPDSSAGKGRLEGKTINLTSRQSVCDIEVDASVDDILNERDKMYSSLSQTRSDVKMVQSLVPIWEEYSRSGTPEAANSPVLSRPLPEIILGRFIDGLEYDLALTELCIELEKTYPLKVSATEGDKLLEKSIILFNGSGGAHAPRDDDQSNCSKENLMCPGDKCANSPLLCSSLSPVKKAAAPEKRIAGIHHLSSTIEISSFQTGTTEKECTVGDALGLLSWLASSQAVEEFSADDELVREAIITPLFPSKSFRETLEIAHLDYESASQRECQDILDSVLNPEGFKEQASSSSHEVDLAVNLIPQLDGSFDDSGNISQKFEHSEANTTSMRAESSAGHVGKGTTTSGSKRRRSKVLWGPLPIPVREKDHEDSECPLNISSQNEKMPNDSESSLSSGSKEARCCDYLKADTGVESTAEKEGNMVGTCSVRDLMRKKKFFRMDESEADLHKSDMAACCLERFTIDRERRYLLPIEASKVEPSIVDKGDVVQDNATWFPACKQDASMQGYGFLPIDNCSPNQKSLLLSGQRMQSNVILNKHRHFWKKVTHEEGIDVSNGSPGFPVKGESLTPAVSTKFPSACQSRHLRTAVCSSSFRGHEDETPGVSWSFMKDYNCSVESKNSRSQLKEKQSVYGDSEYHQYESHSGDEHLRENLYFGTEDLTNALVEKTYTHDIWKHMSVDNIAQKGLLEIQFTSGLHKGKDALKHVEMTFSTMPPLRYEVEVVIPSEDSPETGGSNINDETLAFNCLSVDASKQWINDLPPFFPSNFEDEKLYKLYADDANHLGPQNFAVGVPTHFQNDGSVLYLLTPAVSPPTLESICQWILEVMKRDYLNNGAGDSCDEVSPEPNATQFSRPDPSRQDNIRPHKNRDYTSNIGIVSAEQHTVSKHMKEHVLRDNWNDLSQFSCPDLEEKSHPTPLSQIGFCDPASVGGGQQLTLISIEVQAESQGDLRSDPKVDAINILSLAIQEDASHTLDVYVLMRGNNESCGRNVDGVSEYKIVIFNDEKLLLGHFVKIISSVDPDILMGWEIQGGSLGFVAERAAHLGISLLKKISRTPAYEMEHEATGSFKSELGNVNHETFVPDTSVGESIIEDEWGRTHASGIHVTGRIVLNIWRLMRSELRLNFYSIEAVAKEVLRQKIPSISCKVLNQWFSSGPGQARYRCIEYVTKRAKLNLQIMNKLDMINRTSELARVFGIDFFSVLSRGSQFRVESMLLRLAHTQNYLAISPGHQQVASQPAMECLPLVMEPESGFYVDPVVVLDFQSLYPSMIIAYNLCFSTCLGTVVASKANVLGVSSYTPDPKILKDLKQELFLTPNGIMYVPPKVRKGVLPRLLEEILSTRIMLKQAMKKLTPSQKVLQRILNARQLALKLIANVTYGYTAAGFSGRMPCAELADSIVQCGRRTLESAISFVNKHDKWKARVIYGDTDSMFVLLKGRSREEAFRIGNEIASAITTLNPHPVTLKMEKVYHPCFLLTKKRYVGYSFESADQVKPTFDAKGIETVRRDTCPAVAKCLERSTRLFFEHQDILVVKTYVQRQWKRILSGKISLQDFVFAKEVRLGTYSARASTLPPAAIVASKAMRMDPRAEPRYGERVPYFVVHGEPGARLVDMVVDPSVLLDINSPYRLNELYYITKQIIPALQRVFGLVSADVKLWFAELPRPVRSTLAKRHSYVSHSGSSNDHDDNIMPESSKRGQMKRSRIDTYYISKYCTLCGDSAQTSTYFCDRCSKTDSYVAAALIGKASKLEREIQHMAAICRHCGGGDWVIESGVKCTSLSCSVFYERRKVQKELLSFTSLTTLAGFYPTSVVEWF